MLCTFRDKTTDEVIEVKEVKPVCGEDFCDSCGDCLACGAGDDCCMAEEGTGHYFVKYTDRKEETE